MSAMALLAGVFASAQSQAQPQWQSPSQWTEPVQTQAESRLAMSAQPQPAPPVQAVLPERVGRLALMEGEVQSWNDSRQAWEAALLNLPVTSRSAFWTGASARAEVTAGSAALRMDSLTQANLLRLDDGGTDVDVPRGSVGIRLRAPGDPAWQVAARDSIVTLSSPGSYRIDVDAVRGALTVQVFEGSAELVAADRRIPVPTGQQVSLDLLTWQVRSQSPAVRTAFDEWNALRDREQERLQAWNYVSPEMTGAESLDGAGYWSSDPGHGAVWYPTAVAPGWAPYRNGRWVWRPPWGWTWVEDAPWGFAPFHYGQWVMLNGLWGWAPGPFVRRPVYLPARPGAWGHRGQPGLPIAGFAAGQGLAAAMPVRPPRAAYPLPRFSSQYPGAGMHQRAAAMPSPNLASSLPRRFVAAPQLAHSNPAGAMQAPGHQGAGYRAPSYPQPSYPQSSYPQSSHPQSSHGVTAQRAYSPQFIQAPQMARPSYPSGGASYAPSRAAASGGGSRGHTGGGGGGGGRHR